MRATSSEERAMLRAILVAPDDDAPKLIYADWLDEHGDGHRADLIRGGRIVRPEDANSIAMAMGVPIVGGRGSDSEYATYQHHGTGSAAFEGDGRGGSYWWRMGFVWSIRMDHDEFLKRAAAIFAIHPITRVELRDKGPIGFVRGPRRTEYGFSYNHASVPSTRWRIDPVVPQRLAGRRRRNGHHQSARSCIFDNANRPNSP